MERKRNRNQLLFFGWRELWFGWNHRQVQENVTHEHRQANNHHVHPEIDSRVDNATDREKDETNRIISRSFSDVPSGVHGEVDESKPDDAQQ